ncbi:MAG TPA: MBL fold metallo-hydrolase [Candidatus Lokiarchaeia archaeon]|nr:MBL fold metallo-hydrolase [Candidatus Lokiarchaeia archaeon]
MGHAVGVEVLHFGSLSLQYGETPDPLLSMTKRLLGVGGESSMTLVQSDGATLLIDTSFINEGNVKQPNIERNARHVAAAFARYDHKLEDVQEIFVTHWHHDHFGNIGLFPNALVRFAGISKKKVERTLANFNMLNECAEVRQGADWHEGLAVIPTPGHNTHHHSVVIAFDDATLVAAGDAIVSQSYYDHGAVWTYNTDFQSERVAKESMAKIRDIADIIIPGHGHPFENYLHSRKLAWKETKE